MPIQPHHSSSKRDFLRLASGAAAIVMTSPMAFAAPGMSPMNMPPGLPADLGLITDLVIEHRFDLGGL